MTSRRLFLRTGLLAGGALATGSLHSSAWGSTVLNSNDVVSLGPDKISLSRLAIGTGTFSGDLQRKLGFQGFADMLQFGFDQGITFWDTADSYKTHPYVKEGLKRVSREKVTILTKTRAQTAKEMRADLDRFRKEVGTDYFDVLLLHALRSADWASEHAGAMEVLEEAREKGIVRTHGFSCHSIEALRTAANTPWARVVLARINSDGMRMDAGPEAVVPVLREIKAAGKGVIGMKIIGEGGLRDRVDETLRFVLGLGCVDCFTIGAADQGELTDLIQRIPNASSMAEAA